MAMKSVKKLRKTIEHIVLALVKTPDHVQVTVEPTASSGLLVLVKVATEDLVAVRGAGDGTVRALKGLIQLLTQSNTLILLDVVADR